MTFFLFQRKLPLLARQCTRKVSSTCPPGHREGIYPDLTKIREWQARMQVDIDSVPVYLKAGPSDKFKHAVLLVGAISCVLNGIYIIADTASKY